MPFFIHKRKLTQSTLNTWNTTCLWFLFFPSVPNNFFIHLFVHFHIFTVKLFDNRVCIIYSLFIKTFKPTFQAWKAYCVKGARIRSYSAPYFPAFRRNTNLFVLGENAGKCGTRITPYGQFSRSVSHLQNCKYSINLTSSYICHLDRYKKRQNQEQNSVELRMQFHFFYSFNNSSW